MLNELRRLLQVNSTVTASALSQARMKLKHEAFIELNRDCILTEYYRDEKSYQKYLGFRLLAIDCSFLRLPETISCREEFGSIKIHDTSSAKDSFVQARASVLYDVLNSLVVDGVIASRACYERELARKHYDHLTEKDLILLDRGYPGYNLFAELSLKKVNFVARCSEVYSKSFRFGHNQKSIEVVIKNNKYSESKQGDFNYPNQLKLRALKIRLKTGEYEILVTSLTDSEKYPYEIFKKLYGLRWGIETMFKALKSRLTLENFSGRSAETVKQDFYSTLFIYNLESVITEDLNQDLLDQSAENNNRYPRQINKAVSYNAIKDRAFELLDSEKNLNDTLEELSALLTTNLIHIRNNREHPDRVPYTKRGRDPKIHFHRNIAKFTF